MSLVDGNYLGKEICAFCNDWLIVYDGKCNYIVFDSGSNRVISRFKSKRLPTNDVDRGTKDIEYFSNFDNALEMGLLNIVGNGGHFDR